MTNGLGYFAGSSDDLPEDEPYPGIRRRQFSTDRATVTMYRFSSGAVFPRHRHHQEQITLIQQGGVDFSVGDEVKRLTAGGWLVVPPDLEHQIHAADGGAEVVAVVIPPRDDRDPYMVV